MCDRGRGRVPRSDQNLIIRLKPNLSRESAAGELAASLASGYFLSTRVSGDVLATRAQLIRSLRSSKATARLDSKMLSLVALLEPGPGAKRGGIRKGIERPHSILDDRYGKNKADARTTTRKRKLLDLLPRRHVGRRRPQNRVELRLGRGQIIQVGVAKRF